MNDLALTTSITRRELLRLSAVAGAAGLLASCGVSAPKKTRASVAPLPPKTGALSVANWPLYIDADVKTKGHPTVEQFQRETGTAVRYKEAIDDTETFFGTLREPLAAGKPTGWDIAVLSDWILARMIRLDYVEPLHLDAIPNFTANAAAAYKNPSYDPGSAHSIPWQAGITGIAYNPKLTGRAIDSVADLFDPAFRGKVGMFSEMLDSMCLTLLLLGVEPARATQADAKAARDKIAAQRKAGIVRNFYGQEYGDALANGDLALTIAWSGDIFQLQESNPELRFVVPKEGGILWTDTMIIPKGAANIAEAHAWMNFYYRPEIAARVTESVQYVSTVPASRAIILADAEARPAERAALQRLANSDLLYPDDASLARLHRYPGLSEDDEKAWNQMFQEATQG